MDVKSAFLNGFLNEDICIKEDRNKKEGSAKTQT